MDDQTQNMTPVRKYRLEEARTRFTRPAFMVQLALLLGLLATPLVIPSFRVMDVVAKIMIFSVVVASFDLILGYTGILSFAHGMFFGLGAYSMALLIYHSGKPAWYHFPLAVLIALGLSVAVALLISFFSLRIKAIFFAFMTLALAEFGHILGYQWSDLTMGEDGISFNLPGIFNVNWSGGTFLGTELNGRLVTYYLILVVTVLLFVGLVRFVRSPLGGSSNPSAPTSPGPWPWGTRPSTTRPTASSSARPSRPWPESCSPCGWATSTRTRSWARL